MKNKRFRTLALVCALPFVMTACAGEQKVDNTVAESTIAETTTEEETTAEETTEASSEVEAIDFTTDGGILKYTGYEMAEEELKVERSDGLNPDVVLLKFQFTSKEEQPTQVQDVFYIKVFQNGVALDMMESYSAGATQYKLIENFFGKEVLKDTTIECAQGYELQDKSPLTVFVYDCDSSDNYQQMTVDLSGGDVGGVLTGEMMAAEEETSEAASVDAASIDAALQGKWHSSNGMGFDLSFENGKVTGTIDGVKFEDGLYMINTTNGEIVFAITNDSNGERLMLTMPYEYEYTDGELKFSLSNVAMEKQ